MRREPPQIATWLLEHFSCDDALTGDLVEQFHQGRSRRWYWSQTLAAIATHVYKDVRFHPVLVFRALVIGWIAMELAKRAFVMAMPSIYALYVWEWLRELPRFHILLYLFGAPSLFWIMLISIVDGAIGWLVAYLHRTQRVTTVLLFAFSVFVVELPHLPWIVNMTANSWTNSRYLPYLVSDLLGVFLPPLLIVLGGLWRLSKPGKIQQEQGIAKAE